MAQRTRGSEAANTVQGSRGCNTPPTRQSVGRPIPGMYGGELPARSRTLEPNQRAAQKDEEPGVATRLYRLLGTSPAIFFATTLYDTTVVLLTTGLLLARVFLAR